MEKLILLNIAIALYLAIRPMFNKPEWDKITLLEAKKAMWTINNPPRFNVGDKVMAGGVNKKRVLVITGYYTNQKFTSLYDESQKFERIYLTDTGHAMRECETVPYIECDKKK